MGDDRTRENIAELERRGYKMFIDQDVNENFWKKGESVVSIHTVRSSPLEYFKSILDKKDKFNFEVLQ